MTLNARYTDEDVRRSEDLYQAALKHLRGYQGDFSFLVSAKNYLEEYGDIPVATARGVLNCMRADPMAAMALPQTPNGRFLEAEHSLYDPWRQRPLPPITPEEPELQRQRPAFVTLKTQWHVQYALSTYPTAEVYHIMRPERSTIRWYPHLGGFGYNIAVWCMYPLGRSYILTNDTRNRRVCKLCHKRMIMHQETT